MNIMINYEDEYYDLSHFISEMIIEKMDINYICEQKCKGLCSFCGINLNKVSCNHKEKELKFINSVMISEGRS